MEASTAVLHPSIAANDMYNERSGLDSGRIPVILRAIEYPAHMSFRIGHPRILITKVERVIPVSSDQRGKRNPDCETTHSTGLRKRFDSEAGVL